MSHYIPHSHCINMRFLNERAFRASFDYKKCFLTLCVLTPLNIPIYVAREGARLGMRLAQG